MSRQTYEHDGTLHCLFVDQSTNTCSFATVDRLKRSSKDRDRRRLIIAKLAQKRKEYRQGLGTERESFQDRVKTSVIRHKYHQKQQQQRLQRIKQEEPAQKQAHSLPPRCQSDDSDDSQSERSDKVRGGIHHKIKREETERKSESVSTSLSISPIHPSRSNIPLQQHRRPKGNHDHNHSAHSTDQTLNFSKISVSKSSSSNNSNSRSKSRSPSPSPPTPASPRRHSLSALSQFSRHQDDHQNGKCHRGDHCDGTFSTLEADESFDREARIDEIRILKAQNQRLSNKLEHVDTELVETKVFLRSERKRNKNLFDQFKLKEEEVQDLNQQIDELEVEIEEKDRKCIECVEKLSVAEQQNKTLVETLAMNRDLNAKLQELQQKYRSEHREWQSKYRQISDQYTTAKRQYQQQMDIINEELDQKERTETENIIKFNEVIDTQNVEMDAIKRLNQRLLDSVDEITDLLQIHIKSNGDEPAQDTVSQHLSAMIDDSADSDEEKDDEIRPSDDECIKLNSSDLRTTALDAEAKGKIELLVQSLIGVIDKSNGLEQHNDELSCYLEKYENGKDNAKRTISEYERKCKNQQDRMQRLQQNYTILTEEKAEIENKVTENTKELQRLYQILCTATDELQNIAVQITDSGVIGDIDIHQCIELINEAMLTDRTEMKKMKMLLNQMMAQYHNQMDKMDTVFRVKISEYVQFDR